MKGESLSSNQMILDIASMRSQAQKLENREVDYNSVLQAIIKDDIYYDDDLEIPSIKQLGLQLNLSYDKVRRYIRKIYDDLTSEDGCKLPFEFKEVEFSIGVNGFNGYVHFIAKSLPMVPRVGESFCVPYFKAILGTDHFFVETIQHYLEDQRQVVHIQLKAGFYNAYWHYRKDKALEEGEIGFTDIYNKSEFQLKQMLGVKRYL